MNLWLIFLCNLAILCQGVVSMCDDELKIEENGETLTVSKAIIISENYSFLSLETKNL